MEVTYWNSYDLGLNYVEDNRHVLVGSYFFLSTNRIEHRRMAYHVLALFAELGGLGSGAFALIAFFCTDVTFMLVVNKFI